jgi:hypothetical protein
MLAKRGLAVVGAGIVAEAAFLAVYWIYSGRGSGNRDAKGRRDQGPSIP